MDVILIPGLWLAGESWGAVMPVIESAGHRAHPITFPGMESADADRASVTLDDVVGSVVDAIDAAAGPVLLVGHSAGGGVAHAGVDARPDRVAAVIYVGGFPAGDGEPVVGGFPVEAGSIRLPDWEEFDDADIADLDEAMRAEFRRRAIPSPGCLTTEPLRLGDDRRYDVPATMVCPEFTSDSLRSWMEQGLEPVRELARLHNVAFVDLPAGHWPQFTRPEDLGRCIVDRAAAQ